MRALLLAAALSAAALAAAAQDSTTPPAGPGAAGVDTGLSVVAGFSSDRISITANFDGSEILVYGAVKRETPIVDDPPLQVIITIEGPPETVTVRKKARRFGIWINTDSVTIDRAPAFYAIATTAPLDAVLSKTDDLRHKISIARAIRSVGAAGMAADAPSFVDALIRVRGKNGLYILDEGDVSLKESTLFSARIPLPSKLVEGTYNTRIFLTRGGEVLTEKDAVISVQKEGLERWLYRLAKDQPLIYGLLSLFIAIAAGWGASTAFRLIKN